MTDALEEKVARAICLSKQRAGDTDRIAAQYVDTFWRDYLPEARIAVATLVAALAKPASEPADGAAREAVREAGPYREAAERLRSSVMGALCLATCDHTEAHRLAEYVVRNLGWDAAIAPTAQAGTVAQEGRE